MVSYGLCNTTEVGTIMADTETLIADLTIPSGRGGTIKKIRVAVANIVEGKAPTGFVELKLGSHPGPYLFPITGTQVASASTAGSGAGITTEIDVDIPVDANETVKLYLTMAEAAKSAFAGIIWVA